MQLLQLTGMESEGAGRVDQEQGAKEDKVPLMLRLPDSLHGQVKELATKRFMSLNDLITQACREFVERQESVNIDDLVMVLRATGVDEGAIGRAIAALRQRSIG